LWKGARSIVAHVHVVSFLAALLAVLLMIGMTGCAAKQPGTIGAALGKRTDGRLFVRGVPAGQGADKAGLEIDDEIITIDGKSVVTMSNDDVRAAVRGDVGTSMNLLIERRGERKEVKVERMPLLSPEREEKRKSSW
jgi:C-terminal processing protease CtpA/Prc